MSLRQRGICGLICRLVPITFMVAATLSACVMFPTQLPDRRPFEDDRLGFIQTGVSTKQDISREMANFPVRLDSKEAERALSPKIYRGGASWLYAQRREEFQLAVVSQGGSDTIGDVDFRFLLINFDPNGVVTDYQALKSEGGCSRDRVCVGNFASGLEYQLLTTDAEDQAVKQRELVADRCDVFMFGNPRASGSIRIDLDDEFVGEILDKDQYYFVSIEEGGHRFTLSRRFYSPQNLFSGSDPTMYEFECAGRERSFFDLKPRRGEIEVTEENETDGWRAVNRRLLTLIED